MTIECVLCDKHFRQTIKNPGCICPECLLEQVNQESENSHF